MSLIQYVAGGTFKETFQVQAADGTPYALKVYKSTSRSEREQREIDAMQRCSHPNIARLIGLDTFAIGTRQHPYLLEEFIGGGSLGQHLDAGKAFNPKEIHNIGLALIEAVVHIAGQDLVHRDIKPDNIVFREDGVTPVIIDFGLVRDLTALSLTGTSAHRGPGSPFFAAPEQLNNEKRSQGWRTDQFGLGITLAYCALGRHPFAYGADQHDAISNVMRKRSPNPAAVSALRAVGLTALPRLFEPHPVRRYTDLDTLRTEWSTQQAGR
jgi:serine/threonine protein kinase